MKAIQKCGYPIVNLSRNEYENKIKEIQSDPSRRDLLTGIINDYNMSRSVGMQDFPVTDSGITITYLRQLGFEWPEVDTAYLEKLIRYMESIGFIFHAQI